MIINIVFFIKKNTEKSPVGDFLEKLQTKDRAKVLACLKNIEELGFNCPRVQFRQIKGQLWEIKIKSISGSFRIFYVSIKSNILVLLHAYKKKSKKAPNNEIQIAQQRLIEVFNNEENYT